MPSTARSRSPSKSSGVEMQQKDALDAPAAVGVPKSPRSSGTCCGLSWVLLARIVLGITLVLVAIGAGLAIWQLIDRHAENHVVAWFVGGVFTLLSVPITIYDIAQHWMHWHSQKQVYYVRILGMIIIYAVESWSALRFKDASLYLETIRDAYESYVIYCFFQLLVMSIGGEQAVIRNLKALGRARTARESKGGGEAYHTLPEPSSSLQASGEEDVGTAAHVPPFCCLPRWRMGSPFLHWTRLGVFQYIIVKLACTAVTLITSMTGVYGNGEFRNFSKAFVYVSFAVNASQIWAVYCLVLFYHELLTPLKGLGISPVGKLLVIKGVVFLTWWQGIVLSGLVYVQLIQPTLTYSADEVADGLQNFLITMEMLGFALIHHFLFHWTDCDPDREGGSSGTPLITPLGSGSTAQPERGFLGAAMASILPVDVVKDSRSLLGRDRARTLSGEAPAPTAAAAV